MVWPFLKKEKKETGKKISEEKILELPELPELPPLPKTIETLPSVSKGKTEIKNELPPLPSFPKTLIGEQISRDIAKRAVEEPSGFSKAEKSLTRELSEKEPVETIRPADTIKPRKAVKEIKPDIKIGPVFVRIDKYRQALAFFQEIKKKILEIENLLRNIKEIKTREEAELQEWEQEIEEAKAKLDKIDETIFKKLEE
jgi:hypothetical protein